MTTRGPQRDVDGLKARAQGRREFLKRSAVAGIAVAYAAPAIDTLTAQEAQAQQLSGGGSGGPKFLSCGAFVVSNLDLANNPGNLNWWGAQWYQNNPFSPVADSSVHAFKGFVPCSSDSSAKKGSGFFDKNGKPSSVPVCGGTWVADPGNSGHPPDSVPQLMYVIVATYANKAPGALISGDVHSIIVVDTTKFTQNYTKGYGPNPGHEGWGSVAGVYC